MNELVSFRLAKIVKFHRKKARLSQEGLARLAGVGKTVVYDLEKGKNTLKFMTICAILLALNIRLSFESPLMSEFKMTEADRQ